MLNSTDNWKNHTFPDVRTLKGKRVVVRVDWNMPVVNGEITDTSRFDVTVPFLKELSFAGAKIVLMTHFGDKCESISVIAKHAGTNLPFIAFTPSLDIELIAKGTRDLAQGSALLIENVRMWKGEEDNLPSLGRDFASLGEVFINNAFSVSHRKHASVVGIAKNMLSYFGPTFIRELENLDIVRTPKKPALVIIGGAKIKTKLPLIEKYLDQGIQVFVGGAMVHDIWRTRNMQIGQSFHDETVNLTDAFVNHPLLLTPPDVVLSTGKVLKSYEIPKDGVVVDCGPETVEMLAEVIDKAKTIIANGPLGLYEKGWLHGTEQVLVKMTELGEQTYIGGGDTVGIAHSLHILKRFTFVSLGGGAMLDYLTSGTLPGIDVIVTQS